MIEIVPDVLPDEITRVAGTVAFVELLVNLIENPAFGAGPVKVTVPVEPAPPLSEAGLRVIEPRPIGLIVSVVCLVTELRVALTVAS